MKNKFSQYTYYFVVGTISLIVLIFFPMIGSEVPVGFHFPENPLEWSIFLTTKILTAILNVLIFHSFVQQAKINIKDNDEYKRAIEIMGRVRKHEYKPRSPKRFFGKEYGCKGVTIAVGTATSAMVLTQAILTYDYISLISYTLTIIMGIIFGILEMKKVEEYWTTEFVDYADLINEKKEDSNNV